MPLMSSTIDGETRLVKCCALHNMLLSSAFHRLLFTGISADRCQPQSSSARVPAANPSRRLREFPLPTPVVVCESSRCQPQSSSARVPAANPSRRLREFPLPTPVVVCESSRCQPQSSSEFPRLCWTKSRRHSGHKHARWRVVQSVILPHVTPPLNYPLSSPSGKWFMLYVDNYYIILCTTLLSNETYLVGDYVPGW